MGDEWWTGKELEGDVTALFRSCQVIGLEIRRNIPHLQRKTLSKKSRVPGKIRTEHLPNTRSVSDPSYKAKGYYMLEKFDNVACRPVARQRPQNKQLYNSRCYVIAVQKTFVARQWLNSDHVQTPTDTNATVFSTRSVLRYYLLGQLAVQSLGYSVNELEDCSSSVVVNCYC
jgi:hypothetical protein